MRPIYLISKTPYEGVIHIPILKTLFFTPSIDFSLYEGIVVTSKQIVQALESYAQGWKSLSVIAVSEPTAEVFRNQGCNVVSTANGYGAEVGEIIVKHYPTKRWIYLRPETVASEWAEKVRRAGVVLDEAVMYKTECDDDASVDGIDPEGILIFTSPSSVRCFLKRYAITGTQTVIAIGMTTRSALDEAREVLISPETSVASAVDLAYKIARNLSAF